MAVSLLSHVVTDLCIGKPAVRSLPPSAHVVDALAALRAGGDPFVFVDVEHPRAKTVATACVIFGVADVLCYVCGDRDKLLDRAAALGSPVTALAAAVGHDVTRRVEPQTSLLQVLDILVSRNFQSLLVPLHPHGSKRHHHVSAAAAADLCVLTREDIVRHLFSSISLFSPVAALTVASLGLVRRDVPSVHLDDDALAAVPLLKRAIADGTTVAVVADGNALVGEISPAVLSSCDVETGAAAGAALSAGDFMTYIDCSMSTPEFLLCSIKSQLRDKGLHAVAELMDAALCTGDVASLPTSPLSSSSTSSDEESVMVRARCTRRHSLRWRSAEDVAACERNLEIF